MTLKAACLAGPLALALSTGAYAATATGTLNLSITITSTCSVVSATAINFGSVSAIAANIDQTSTLTVNCSSTTPYTVGLGVGGGTGATTAVRKMTNGANVVNYTLYRDAARTLPWGATLGTNTYSGTGSGLSVSVPVYGRVPVQATPTPGLYSDTVVVTVNY